MPIETRNPSTLGKTYWWATQNQTHDRLPRHTYILEPSQNMYLTIRQHDPHPSRILNRKLRLPILPCNAPNSSAKMVTVKRLDVLNLERLDVQVIEPQQRNRIVDIKPQRERADEIGALL